MVLKKIMLIWRREIEEKYCPHITFSQLLQSKLAKTQESKLSEELLKSISNNTIQRENVNRKYKQAFCGSLYTYQY